MAMPMFLGKTKKFITKIANPSQATELWWNELRQNRRRYKYNIGFITMTVLLEGTICAYVELLEPRTSFWITQTFGHNWHDKVDNEEEAFAGIFLDLSTETWKSNKEINMIGSVIIRDLTGYSKTWKMKRQSVNGVHDIWDDYYNYQTRLLQEQEDEENDFAMTEASEGMFD